MATTRSFSAMLNEYLAIDLLREETIKRDYLLQKTERDDNWKGGTIPVPFKGARASSISFGSLVAEDNISENVFVRGELTAYKELWGAMKWNSTDIMQHGKISEQSFLDDLPGQIEDFVNETKESLSLNLLNGSNFATLTSDATANDGKIIVDRPEYFTLNQEIYVDDDDTASTQGFVDSIDMELKTIVCMTARGGATPVDWSGLNMTVAQNAVVYHPGAQANSFTSLKSQLLSLTNGGSAALFGQTKLAYPYLQAVQELGSAYTSSNILDKLFDFHVNVRKIGKGNPTVLLMDYTNLGYVLKLLEIGSGPYRHVSTKANLYGWTEVVIMGPKGELTMTAVNEMTGTEIYCIDWSAFKLFTNGFFHKQVDPEGKAYYVIRATTGYTYIVDICCFGEFVCYRPSYCGVAHSISI